MNYHYYRLYLIRKSDVPLHVQLTLKRYKITHKKKIINILLDKNHNYIIMQQNVIKREEYAFAFVDQRILTKKLSRLCYQSAIFLHSFGENEYAYRRRTMA